MKRILLINVIIGIVFLGATSCDKITDRVTGNGNLTEETRVPGNFNGVALSGSYKVVIYPADFNEVVVEAESNLLPYIETVMKGGELVIKEKNNCWVKYTKTVTVFVYTTQLHKASISGSGSMWVNPFVTSFIDYHISGSGDIYAELNAEEITVKISGSGNIHLKGTSPDSDFNISGSGSIKAFDLITRDCYSKISGSGEIEIFVTNFLQAVISGSGSVFYKGYPQLNVSISGSGEVIHKP